VEKFALLLKINQGDSFEKVSPGKSVSWVILPCPTDTPLAPLVVAAMTASAHILPYGAHLAVPPRGPKPCPLQKTCERSHNKGKEEKRLMQNVLALVARYCFFSCVPQCEKFSQYTSSTSLKARRSEIGVYQRNSTPLTWPLHVAHCLWIAIKS